MTSRPSVSTSPRPIPASVTLAPAGAWSSAAALTRRQAAGRLAAWALLGLTGCRTSKPEAAALERFEWTEPQMGVPFRVVLYAPTRAQAETAARAAMDRIAALNAVMSDYDSDSELSRLSATAGSGQAVPVSADLWRVLSRAQHLARLSEGAFDITVGPAVVLWRKARRDRALPDPTRLARARERMGWRHLELDARRRTARLLRPGMRLDLGGIAKGDAVDQALKVLAAYGIRHALVSGGGDLAVSHPPPGRSGWRVEVAPPPNEAGLPRPFVSLRHAALATSGDVFQHVEIEGVRYSHIVDPRTGLGLTDHSQVSVIARDGLTADSLSTAISVLGPERGLRLADRFQAGVYILRAPAGRWTVTENRWFRRWLES